jgi:hypothetical protein
MIRNGHQTTTITRTSHRSREIAIFLGPLGTLVMSMNRVCYSSSISETPAVHQHLHYLDELRRVYFTRISTHIGFITGIKQRPLPQLVTGHVKWLFSRLTGNFGNGHETEPVTMKLTIETRSVNLHLLCLDEMRRICFYARLLSLY